MHGTFDFSPTRSYLREIVFSILCRGILLLNLRFKHITNMSLQIPSDLRFITTPLNPTQSLNVYIFLKYQNKYSINIPLPFFNI
jgi:hypothetical protein